MPVFDARSMNDVYNKRAVKAPNLIIGMVAALGAMGLVLAVIGLYGLLAYSVSRRTREIGIRMAIGADRPVVLRMILRQGLMLGVAGVAAGLLIRALSCGALPSILFFYFRHICTLPFFTVFLLLAITTISPRYLPSRCAFPGVPV